MVHPALTAEHNDAMTGTQHHFLSGAVLAWDATRRSLILFIPCPSCTHTTKDIIFIWSTSPVPFVLAVVLVVLLWLQCVDTTLQKSGLFFCLNKALPYELLVG